MKGSVDEKLIIALNATSENVGNYGFLIGEKTSKNKLTIPFYDHVEEGENIPFEYNDQVVLRTARIHPSDKPNIWLERHLLTTQFFIGLGSSPYALILGSPTHEETTNSDLPNLDTLKCFIFEPGTGILLNKGTWHDFPMALSNPVTCLTGNSIEVVNALVKMKEPMEMNHGDIYKINLIDRFNIQLRAKII